MGEGNVRIYTCTRRGCALRPNHVSSYRHRSRTALPRPRNGLFLPPPLPSNARTTLARHSLAKRVVTATRRRAGNCWAGERTRLSALLLFAHIAFGCSLSARQWLNRCVRVSRPLQQRLQGCCILTDSYLCRQQRRTVDHAVGLVCCGGDANELATRTTPSVCAAPWT